MIVFTFNTSIVGMLYIINKVLTASVILSIYAKLSSCLLADRNSSVVVHMQGTMLTLARLKIVPLSRNCITSNATALMNGVV